MSSGNTLITASEAAKEMTELINTLSAETGWPSSAIAVIFGASIGAPISRTDVASAYSMIREAEAGRNVVSVQKELVNPETKD